VQRPPTADLEQLLRELAAGGVEFIVVGGAAAVIHGAPVTTQDLDIVPNLEGEHEQRLLAVLGKLDSRLRPVRPDRDIAPGPEHFVNRGQLNLVTSLGPLDVLCKLHDARGYAELLPHSREIVDGDLRVRVIDLETLIEIKRSTGRERDLMVIPLLLALRDRSRSGT
jgi:predicted nucleotidyltransferase